MEVKATVTSMDTVTEGMHSGVHPWMVTDGHGYCDIHGHCDRGVCIVVSIHGWSWMVTANVTSMDTMTEGYAQWCPSMDGHVYCDIHGHCDRGVGTVASIHK